MAIRSLKSGTFSRSGLVGNPVIMLGSYESIATVTPTGSSSTIQFTSIPGTYSHLQLRAIVKTTTAGSSLQDANLTFNADSSASYSRHILYGNGASALAYGNSGNTAFTVGGGEVPTAGYTNIFGAYVIDILDYANTNKNKTVRALTGADVNGAGQILLSSTVWSKTNAITSIELAAPSGNWASGSSFALYGVN